MTTPAPQDINLSINTAFGSAAEREVHTFSSGAVSISIRTHGHAVIIDGTSDGQWGVSIDPDDAAAMAGHDTVTDSFSKALDIARSALPAS
ncbi:hypothetical protein SAMN02745673_01883 [Marinactinospora thermotolerans DSM 45154]|uniref:Uncharacterized protein n=1 Tax=Marinactinospora thermotolerans DSM 45154 TaxID=1122192 RepID=A0A1T4PMN8_9ACTN|nr:hypothetical protein [Marinactinospora thermotolerans]SJZ92477.1 hypothetical protein SAMN02745673_01883 [Marinactinospora thermotolerans DSM 45154]